jgi:hypothetical protein
MFSLPMVLKSVALEKAERDRGFCEGDLLCMKDSPKGPRGVPKSSDTCGPPFRHIV